MGEFGKNARAEDGSEYQEGRTQQGRADTGAGPEDGRPYQEAVLVWAGPGVGRPGGGAGRGRGLEKRLSTAPWMNLNAEKWGAQGG